jgi:hypothetical protein
MGGGKGKDFAKARRTGTTMGQWDTGKAKAVKIFFM